MITAEKWIWANIPGFVKFNIFNFLMKLVWFGQIWNDIFYHRSYYVYLLDKLDEKYEKRWICSTGFSTFNKIRKVLPETGLRYPLLFSG